MRLATMSMMVRPLFGGDALERRRTVRCHRGNAGAFVRGVARVEDEDWDALLDGGQNGSGMQDLRAEVGELGSLFKADGLDAQRVGADARVGGHDAVDVGPDLDGSGVEAAAD